MKKFILASLLSLSLFNTAAANNNSDNIYNSVNNIKNPTNLSVPSDINAAKINWLDNYLESIILNLAIKKIDLKLNILQTYNNDNSKVKTLFLSHNSDFNDVNTLQNNKAELQQQLNTLNSSLAQNKLFVKSNNDLNTKKLLNNNNFSLLQDKSYIIPFIKNYQNILRQNQQITKTLQQEINQGKRSELDIKFSLLNELDNQIFLKKAAKLYFIEKLKQQPTINNFNELNSYLLNPLDVNSLKF